MGHVAFAEPYCEGMRAAILEAMKPLELTVHPKGTLVCMEGPLFSSRAESFLYRQWKADLIGMTALPEAKLAREAEMCLAIVAMVTDYDCWKGAEESVTIEMVLQVMADNTRHVQEALPAILSGLGKRGDCACRHAGENAIMTDPSLIPYELRRRLSLFYGKYWEDSSRG